MRRVLVCGGRRYADCVRVFRELDALSPAVVITGGAPGADYFASRWAKERAVPHIEMQAAWDRLGPKAGPVRNQWMIDHATPTLVLAFPGGKGTEDMVRRAKIADVRVVEVKQ